MDRREFVLGIGSTIPTTMGPPITLPPASPIPWRWSSQSVTGFGRHGRGGISIADANGQHVGIFQYEGDGLQAFANVQRILDAVNGKRAS